MTHLAVSTTASDHEVADRTLIDAIRAPVEQDSPGLPHNERGRSVILARRLVAMATNTAKPRPALAMSA